jgi:hypothetical protein
MNPTEYDWLDHPFKFFMPLNITQEAAEQTVLGQTPEFDIMGIPAGKLLITAVERVEGGIQLTVQRRNQ